MKVCSVVGIRPNFVKEYLVNQELKRRSAREVLIHTGQHYDYEMSQAFFEYFDLPAPHHHLQIAKGDNVTFSARALMELARVFTSGNPGYAIGWGLIGTLRASRIESGKSLGYVEFLRMTAGADRILIDSGGVRREACLLEEPRVVLIELSWSSGVSQAGWKVVTGPDPARIADLVRNFEPTGPRQDPFGDGLAHRKVVDGLLRRYGG